MFAPSYKGDPQANKALFTTLNYLFSQTEKKTNIRKLQPLAKVVETLYLILARLVCLLWSCACDASTTPYQSYQQYNAMLKTWRNNFNDFQFFTDERQINRVPSVKYLLVVVDEMEMEDAYQ